MKNFTIAVAASIVLLSGCATTSLPSGDYQYAQNALRDARVAGAETYANAQYATAKATFKRAEKLIQRNRPERAQKLLQLSIAQADLAAAISEAEHAEATVSQLQNY